MLTFGNSEVESRLQIEPELRIIAEMAPEAERGMTARFSFRISEMRPELMRSANANALPDNRRASNSSFNMLPGWTSNILCSSVIVNDLHVPCVPVLEAETKTPRTIDDHRPLRFAITT
jgi:hypothetical protein